jgi:hypothetical protein
LIEAVDPHDRVAVALRVTARGSFVLFWLAYAAGAMATLWGPPFTGLARHGREFGLAFALPFRAVKLQAGVKFTSVVAPIASFNSYIPVNVKTELEGFAVPRRRPVPDSEGVSVEATDV